MHTLRSQLKTVAGSLLVIAWGVPALAQTPAPDPQTALLLEKWNTIGQWIVEMAEAFPEDKYAYRPVPEVRTFAEQLRHLGFWHRYSVQVARGEKPSGAANELPAASYPTKAAIVTVLKQINADGAEVLRRSSASIEQLSNWSGAIEHAVDHYGQMVIYLRLNGIVPPTTAKQPAQ